MELARTWRGSHVRAHILRELVIDEMTPGVDRMIPAAQQLVVTLAGKTFALYMAD